jgi:hypothetical protein
MPRIPLPFGGGLDRETGVMSMQPGGMEDLRNVHLLQGKYQVRRGFERVLTFEDDDGNEQTDILAGIAMRGRRAAVYVTYDSVNYKVNVFIGDATGTWVSWLAEWPFLDASDAALKNASNPYAPVVILAEYNSLVFLAHSVNNVAARAQTFYVQWDELTQVYELNPLFARWEDSGGMVTDQKVRFRGWPSTWTTLWVGDGAMRSTTGPKWSGCLSPGFRKSTSRQARPLIPSTTSSLAMRVIR